MEKSFLEIVAEDIIRRHKQNLSRITVVFPNKRASLFMNDYLLKYANGPTWCPKYTTIKELFCQQSDKTIADPIKLVSDLFKIYTECTASTETFDNFYSWGQLLISDFDDIDKSMADADKVLKNVSNYHEFDDLSYLNEHQKEVLKNFFKSFSDEQDSIVKRRYREIWSNLFDIYVKYNKFLSEQGLAYEGALYREVAEKPVLDFSSDKYIFVGFNLLQEVEKTVFKRLQYEQKAEFYWDYDHAYINDNSGETPIGADVGMFIKQNLSQFPNQLDNTEPTYYDNYNGQKTINVISTPTESIQAHYVNDWLNKENRIKDGRKTAVVMCDENILPNVLHALPEDVGEINITTGYPLSQTPIATLVWELIALQTNGRLPGGDRFRISYVNRILQHPYTRFFIPLPSECMLGLKKLRRYYVTRKNIVDADENAEILVEDIQGDGTHKSANIKLIGWLMKIVTAVGKNGYNEDNPLMQESVFRMYKLLNRLNELLSNEDIQIDTVTLQRLMRQIVDSTTIPFHGEPAVGVQVMGLLETRNLDFEHVLLLSCNEGNLPKGINDASVLSYSIRKAYDLTTVDHKTLIYAYYFYRLLQRASDITILYNESADGLKTGEMSRFILQMLVDGRHKINRFKLLSHNIVNAKKSIAISKNQDVMGILDNIAYLSPTAINRYLSCPMQFYYYTVAGLKEAEQDEDDSIDNRTFGNIFHLAAQLIYLSLAPAEQIETDENGEKMLKWPLEITKNQIEELLKNNYVERFVDKAFAELIFKIGEKEQLPDYNGLQYIHRNVVIHYIRQLLELDKTLAPFSIVGMEITVDTELQIQSEQKQRNVKVGGKIDRLDLITNHETNEQCLRVVDYKTGKSHKTDILSIDELFEKDKSDRKLANYYLQTFLYSVIVSASKAWNPNGLKVRPALLFIQDANTNDYDPTLQISKVPVDDIKEYEQDYITEMRNVIGEILNPSLKFAPSERIKTCEYCAYYRICKSHAMENTDALS